MDRHSVIVQLLDLWDVYISLICMRKMLPVLDLASIFNACSVGMGFDFSLDGGF